MLRLSKFSLKYLIIKSWRQTEVWTLGYDFWIGILRYYWSCLAYEILSMWYDNKKRDYSFYQ